jgi:hypothetical protein
LFFWLEFLTDLVLIFVIFWFMVLAFAFVMVFSVFFPPSPAFCVFSCSWVEESGLLTICFLEREEGTRLLLLLKNRYRIISGSLHS